MRKQSHTKLGPSISGLTVINAFYDGEDLVIRFRSTNEDACPPYITLTVKAPQRGLLDVSLITYKPDVLTVAED